MRNLTIMIVCAMVLVITAPVVALDAGTDVFVPAAARAGAWITDLYILNPNSTGAELTVSWLVRGQANKTALAADYSLEPGEYLVLADVIKEVFGLDSAGGAFRVVSDVEVLVSTRIYNLRDGVTFGQGFEGVPRWRGVAAGGRAEIMGLSQSTGFRSNLVAIDISGSGSTVELSLRDTNGSELASETYELRAFEPVLDPVTELGITSFENATLRAEVTSGAAIVVASRIDNDPDTGDPTTLAAWSGVLDGSDGTYQLAIYEGSGYATGGNLVVADGSVTELRATYMNLEKGSPIDPDCPISFMFGSPEAGVHTLDEYASGVSFVAEYTDGAAMSWTVQLVVSNNQSLSGTIAATGSGFSGLRAGCNGAFPSMELRGGKSSNTPSR